MSNKSKQVLTDLDLVGNNLSNGNLVQISVEVLDTAPSSPKNGYMYYDSVLKAFRIYDLNTWKSILDATQLVSVNGGTINGDLTVVGKITVKELIASLGSLKAGNLSISTASNGYVTLSSLAAGTQLYLTGKSADADKLGGQLPSY